MLATGGSRRMWSGLIVVVVAAALAGCGGDGNQVGNPAVQRLIPDPPEELFDPSLLARRAAGGELSLDPGRWAVGPEGTSLGDRDGLVLARRDRLPRWAATRIRRPAGEIDLIEIEVDGLRIENSVAVSWRAAGTDGRTRRWSLSQRAGRPPAQGPMTFVFRVGSSPGWRGTIKKLRIEIGRRPPVEVRLTAVRTFELVEDPEVLARAADTAWVAGLGTTHRAALIGAPSREIVWPVELGRNSRLEFFWGAPSSIASRVEMSVTAESTDRSADDSQAVLWRGVLDPSETGSWDRWNRAVVDLGELTDDRVTLRFRTDVDTGDGLLRGLPLWGHPEIRRLASDPRPNVVLISLDTLRADRLSIYGYHRPTSPVIDDWAQRNAVVFETVVAPSPWTLPSHLSLFTGISAHRHGVNHPVPVAPSFTTLAERLRAEGYSTMAVTGGRYLDVSYGLHQGFDAFSTPTDAFRNEIEIEVDRAIEWLGAADPNQPFFLFLHSYEVHDPYWPREPAYSAFGGDSAADANRTVMARTTKSTRRDGFRRRREFVERIEGSRGAERTIPWTEIDEVNRLYDSGVARADAGIGRLLEALDQRGLAERSIIALVSDHGEALGEHRLAGHTSLYDHDLLVPMIVAVPGQPGGRRVADQVRLVDLAPTILDLVGTDAGDLSDGVSLRPLLDGKSMDLSSVSVASLTNFGIALRSPSGQKLILQNTPWPSTSGVVERYDTTEDPKEEDPRRVGTARAKQLIEALLDDYRTTATGLVVALENPGPSPVSVRLAVTGGVGLTYNSVKRLDRHGRCSLDPGRALECTVASADRLHLLFEDVTAPRFAIQGSIGPEPSREEAILEVDLGGGPGPWRPKLSPQATGLVLEAWWQGPLWLSGPSPAAADAELRAQLEALGYVE